MFTFLVDLGQQASSAIKVAKEAADRDLSLTPGDLSVVVLTATKNWKPVYKNQEMLTPALRAQLAGAFGQLAWNMSAAEKSRKAA